MISRTEFRGKRVLVFGLGLFGGGASAARWFARRGARVTATDLRSAAQLKPTLERLRGLPIQFVLGRHRRQDILTADLIIKNPGVPENHPLLNLARRRWIPIETDVSLFASLCPVPFVGITGTKGKSTTAALTTAFLKTRYRQATVGGNIGRPLLDASAAFRPPQPLVAELSSWQIEGLSPHQFSPHIGVITNILPDHLNRYPSFSAYARVKRQLLAYLHPGDVAIINADDPLVRGAKVPVGVSVLRFSLSRRSADAFCDQGRFWVLQAGRPVAFARGEDCRLPGDHFRSAVLAAALAAISCGVAWKSLASALRSFKGLPGRLQTVSRRRGVRWVNDTTATAPVAATAALQSFSRRVILIAGGVDKGLPYDQLATRIRARARRVFLLPGSATDKLKRRLRGWRNIDPVASMTEAVQRAAATAQPGETVLLSPGAASFNLFLNEFDRGRAFERAIEQLVS